MVACDEEIFETVNNINIVIEKTCNDCKQILEQLNIYNFLWTVNINDSFEEFLKGNLSMSRQKNGRNNSRNFLSETGRTK